MHRTVTPLRLVQVVLSAVALVLLMWLCVLAVRPSAANGLPTGLRCFGQPGSSETSAIVATVLVVLCALRFRSRSAPRGRGKLVGTRQNLPGQLRAH
jgi:hypothetical protein